ncbi:MAG: cold-shock protein [Acidobacteriota bacterium]|nr:cold-shock protein [Acidobacteriota bacterium]
MQGTVKFFDTRKFYGIVWNEGGGWFFHGSRVIGEPPLAGDEGWFWLDDGTRGDRLAAVEVQVRNGASDQQ